MSNHPANNAEAEKLYSKCAYILLLDLKVLLGRQYRTAFLVKKKGFQILTPLFASELCDTTKLLEFSEVQLSQLQNGIIYLIRFSL